MAPFERAPGLLESAHAWLSCHAGSRPRSQSLGLDLLAQYMLRLAEAAGRVAADPTDDTATLTFRHAVGRMHRRDQAEKAALTR